MINILMSRSSALTSAFAKAKLKTLLKPTMSVVIIGFSFFGKLDEEEYGLEYGLNSEYDQKLKLNFSEYGIEDVKWVYYYGQTLDEQIKLIENADILYFPGGAPDLMFQRIKDKGLIDVLKTFEKIVIGSSAGAMIQLKNYHISKDNEYFNYSMNEGLGYIDDFFVEVHFRRRNKQKSSMRRVRKTYQKPIYTIPDDGMLVVEDKTVTTLGSAKLYYTKKGINK